MESVDIPEELGEERVSGGRSAAALSGRARARAIVLASLAGAALPLVGLVSLLLRSRLDPHFENYRLHFLVFGLVGAVAFSLGYAAGEAANRRGDARVLLLSLAFMATGGFLGLHALGTQGILFSEELSGFPGRDSGGIAGERRLRSWIGVRRCPSGDRAARDAPPEALAPGGGDRHGGLVPLDGREAAATPSAE
jgi:hypothetical protein